MKSDSSNIRESAQQMIALHGDKAAPKALAECRRLSQAGEDDAAKDWERLYKAIVHIQRKG